MKLTIAAGAAIAARSSSAAAGRSASRATTPAPKPKPMPTAITQQSASPSTMLRAANTPSTRAVTTVPAI
ncbi:hypothetical protein ACVMFA_004231 [Bradyrhizobium liaoningense]